MSLPPRSSYAWIITAHAIAGVLLGALEAARLGNGRLGIAIVPVFALTGLVAGAIIAAVERAMEGRHALGAAIGIAAPSMIVTLPVAGTLFRGAYAQTLPLASVLPFVVPVIGWLGIAGLVWIGRRLTSSDLTTRAIVILSVAGMLGVIVWVERNVLGTGYPDAQSAVAVSVIVLAGIIVRLARRIVVPRYVAAAIAAFVVATGVASLLGGLESAHARQLLANRGDHGKDLVRVWRKLVDLDGDGSSAILGGGDCDDRDADLHPGAVDIAGDKIDQDCDGSDAVKLATVSAEPPKTLAPWRETPLVKDTLARTRDMNILLITVDALRYDMLAPGAAHRSDYPRLTKLLDESVIFTRAFSPAAGTDVALSTLLTGRTDPFQKIETTLPEALRATGRRTSMAVPEEVMRHVGTVMLFRGFDSQRPVYTDWEQANIGDHISAGTTTAEGMRALDKAGDRGWFVWLHYFDVHEHHQLKVPADLREKVWDGGDEKVHRYRALLWNIDRSVGRLLDDLEKRGVLDKTIIVFASDHGESLGEDPRLPATHGQVAYAPLVHIPLAFRVPGVAGGTRDDLVTLRDIAPTVLDLAGIGSAMQVDGLDLVPALLDGPADLRPPKNRALVIHEEHQWAVIEWPYQLVMRPADDLVELYDLDRDPRAKVDISAQHPDVTTRLRGRYAEAPVVRIDRTQAGRVWRDQQAQPPQPRARP
ncbi:MAG: sulfatase-like hydrolase/transferase [Myxococcota bacterium]|nr:sulfatase-like hydrolase/transferase [Myxococcota bacterium]